MALSALLTFVLQLASPADAALAQRPTVAVVADSIRDLGRLRSAQTGFERFRRTALPRRYSNSSRCDVRLGRFCWWYDAETPMFPEEKPVLRARRRALIADLDASARKYPGDDWIAGMRVHYRIDDRDLAGANSVAADCRAAEWWCSALGGYAAHARGDAGKADSMFSAAIVALDSARSCAWRDILPLLRDGDRDAYERATCEARIAMETRFWLLSRPRFAGTANEFRNEYNARRVLTWLGARSTTPHLMPWGDDAAELVLRYGWPVAWSRQEVSGSGIGSTDGGVVGHDPSPSFFFTPARWWEDSATALPPSAWVTDDPRAESRFAPALVKRVTAATAQIARFRRGDSTLVVAAFTASDDSLRAPVALLGASAGADALALSPTDSARTGRARVVLAGPPVLVGIDIADTTTRTLARMRQTFVPVFDTARITLSDLLMYREGEAQPSSADSALVTAIAGDTVTRDRPVGVFWETYGLLGETLDIAVSVERVDRGWIRSARQRLGLTPVDTPIRVRWNDARSPSNRGAAYAIALDLSNLDAGRYRITVSATPAGTTTTASSVREVALINP